MKSTSAVFVTPESVACCCRVLSARQDTLVLSSSICVDAVMAGGLMTTLQAVKDISDLNEKQEMCMLQPTTIAVKFSLVFPLYRFKMKSWSLVL